MIIYHVDEGGLLRPHWNRKFELINQGMSGVNRKKSVLHSLCFATTQITPNFHTVKYFASFAVCFTPSPLRPTPAPKHKTDLEQDGLHHRRHLQRFITARKRSLGQGNIFTSMCHSFCPHVGGWLPSMHHRSHDWRCLHP